MSDSEHGETPDDAEDFRFPDSQPASETTPTGPAQIEVRPPEQSSRRLMHYLELALKRLTSSIEVEGRDHLNEIPATRNLVVATSHLTDLDILLSAHALGNDLNLAIADASLNHRFMANAPVALLERIVGKESFIPIDYRKTRSGYSPRAFNPRNFDPMLARMESNGERILIAAHNPSSDGQFTRAGYGAAYLAEISHALVLPVAVDVEGSERGIGQTARAFQTYLAQPKARVRIGQPFELDHIAGIEHLGEIIGDNRSSEDRQEFFRLKASLEQSADEILNKVKALSPRQKS